ncbi:MULTISPECIES: hypothetical protein [Nocardia]|uniref:hypothetical protein n=1 Tax=Nocardia TaxID=1817 RepID=UPI000B01595F|nr:MULTISPECIES: hypothetical protein [Nocardia]
MSVFDEKSRYLKYSNVLEAVDERGRTVNWVTPARIPAQRLLGEHLRREGQRLDRIAGHYLDDPTGFWRIAAINDAMTADAIADLSRVRIPVREG